MKYRDSVWWNETMTAHTYTKKGKQHEKLKCNKSTHREKANIELEKMVEHSPLYTVVERRSQRTYENARTSEQTETRSAKNTHTPGRKYESIASLQMHEYTHVELSFCSLISFLVHTRGQKERMQKHTEQRTGKEMKNARDVYDGRERRRLSLHVVVSNVQKTNDALVWCGMVR